MSNKVEILIIDPQVDFCEPSGALYVKNAEKDMTNVAEMIKRIGSRLNDIHVTLDTHHLIDVAHPAYWKDSNGNHPNPFTIINSKDVVNGVWVTTLPSQQKRAVEYVQSLEKNGRYPLCIWPPHCLIGSAGHAVFKPLHDALTQWERDEFAIVDYVTKGTNPFTEHYSCFRADVPDSTDPSTQINTRLVQTLMGADLLAICGEARDYCVFNSLKDLVTEFNDDSYIKKIVFLEDASSNVQPLNQAAEDFYEELLSKGMSMSTTKDFLR